MAYTTNYTMLEKMCRGDEISWQEFYRRYAPFIAGIARKKWLKPEEGDEIIQLTMETIFADEALKRYQRQMGKFRYYLAGIVKYQIYDYLRRRSGDIPDEHCDAAAPEDFDTVFAAEYNRYLLDLLLDTLREKVESATFEAFYLLAMEEREPAEVAAMLAMPVASVYAAKSRCLHHLRTMAREIQREDPDFTMPFSR